jgi:hypothetical protein
MLFKSTLALEPGATFATLAAARYGSPPLLLTAAVGSYT